MNSFVDEKKHPYFEKKNDPPLTDGDIVDSFINLDDTDPVIASLFFPQPSSLLEGSDCPSFFKEADNVGFASNNDDQYSHCTFTTVQSNENRELLFADYDLKTSPSPQKQFLDGALNDYSPKSNSNYKPKIETPITLEDILESNAGTCVPSLVFNDFSTLENSSDMFRSFSAGTGAQKKSAQAKNSGTNSDLISLVMPQKNKSVKFTQIKSPYKVHKTKQGINPDYIKNIIQKYNMELNQILVPDGSSDTSTAGQSVSRHLFLRQGQEDREATAVCADPFFETQNEVPRPSPGRPRKERRPTLLKKDANVTLEEKLNHYQSILEDARLNNLPGIFLREQAVSEFCLEDFGKAPTYLTLVLSNFEAVQEFLEQKSLSYKQSYRTIWRVSRSQFDQIVNFEFFLSDEISVVPEDKMEISIFTLIVPGHATKHLITSSQYLEMVNFMLGKDYNHAINDNLAEATVGSDGKMIPTQKHHASRVRSHVKKYLKRHVIKDKRRYTEEDRRDQHEFQYRIALHHIVMQSSVKRPFESKVSVALMELHNAKDALIKQAEFFIFKKLS